MIKYVLLSGSFRDGRISTKLDCYFPSKQRKLPLLIVGYRSQSLYKAHLIRRKTRLTPNLSETGKVRSRILSWANRKNGNNFKVSFFVETFGDTNDS